MIKNIIKEIVKNIGMIVISLFLVVTITFFVFELIPGEVYDLDYIKNENVIENIRQKYGLDKPVYLRYIKTLENTFTFDFGNSFINEGRDVKDIIKTNFPVSAMIGIIAIFISLVVGIFVGNKMTQIKQKRKRSAIVIAFILLTSVPTFVLAVILQYILGVWLKVLPISGGDDIKGYILPILILSISPSIFIARLIERKIIEVKNNDYVISAKVRGISKNTLMYHYILRNSISPILSYLAPIIANLIVGSFVIESIFNIPGLGRYFITSVTNRDYPVVMGLTIFFSIILIGITSIVNILVAIIDYKGDINGEK